MKLFQNLSVHPVTNVGFLDTLSLKARAVPALCETLCFDLTIVGKESDVLIGLSVFVESSHRGDKAGMLCPEPRGGCQGPEHSRSTSTGVHSENNLSMPGLCLLKTILLRQ